MRRGRPKPASVSQGDAEETAWRIHSALADWTGKVDAKASFALTVELAVLAGAVSLSSSTGRLGHLSGAAELALYRIGLAGLVIALLLVTSAVTPQLRSRKIRSEAKENFIFFGHLRDWSATELATALQEKPILPVLSRQLVVMSAIAWRKHRLLQLSIALGTTGTAALAAAAWLGNSR